jgi:Rrf2 family cysteine metabolism transcriptional repressor
VLLGCSNSEEIVDDSSELVTRGKAFSDRFWQRHAKPTRVTVPAIVRDGSDPGDQPNERRLVDDATFQTERHVRAGRPERGAGTVASALTRRLVADRLGCDATGHVHGFQRAAWRQTRQNEAYGLDLGGVGGSDHGAAVPEWHVSARLGPTNGWRRQRRRPTIPTVVLGNPQTAFHVSTRGEYGMRLMVDLARHWQQGSISLHAVAQREDLPEAYLEQLVAVLRKAGLVNGKRGAGGGYMLARDPSAITAGDIVRALEGPIEPQICTAEGDPVLNCIREQDCGTRAVWVKLQSTIAQALDGMTLADLAKEKVTVA